MNWEPVANKHYELDGYNGIATLKEYNGEWEVYLECAIDLKAQTVEDAKIESIEKIIKYLENTLNQMRL